MLYALLTGQQRCDAECAFKKIMRGLNGLVEDRVRAARLILYQKFKPAIQTRDPFTCRRPWLCMRVCLAIEAAEPGQTYCQALAAHRSGS